MISENQTIEERYGLEDIDTIAVGLLVNAPLDQIAEIVAQFGAEWEQDIHEQNIQNPGLLVFQFRGHSWTGILDVSMTDKYTYVTTDTFDDSHNFVTCSWDWELQAQSISQQLHTRTIYYWVDDSGLTIGYVYWENGELMERLEFDEAIWQDNHDEALLDEPERQVEPHLFESKFRRLTAGEIENAYSFVEDFLHEQQAYAATRLSRFKCQRDDFIRIDYIAFV
ncbi:hypothetical protein [Nostoc sp. UHCC 0252]|uniref:hypothetical protein n=1 Tax=Nostoc sp. UHCC 0252 TaxID=3110241 RepID=UPI002B1FB75E|nr:hypothetical protein [Nostoc sp. UHCC 0252]MEA5601677.1 hypothetical protein [Nostoc sp. UHCC 0252]